MRAKFELLNGYHLNHSAYAEMQREAYTDLIAEMKASDEFMTPEYYRWKHHRPAGSAKIAVAWEDDRMVAATSMMPFEIRLGRETVRAWQSSDNVTIPSARGKGCLQGCVHVLEGALKPNEVFYGFPNQNSKRSYIKVGWMEKGIVRPG